MKVNKAVFSGLLVAVFLSAVGNSTAQAAILAFDNFDYTGALTSNGWVAHSGGGAKVINSDGSVATLEQSDGSGEDVNLGFTPQGATDTTYAAFDFNVLSTTSIDDGDLDPNGLYFAHLKDSGFAFRARTGVVNPSGGGDYGIAINADSSGLGDGTAWASDLSFDTVYRAVVSWNAATGESELWIDPTSEASTSVAHTGTNTGDVMEAFALRQSNAYTGFIEIDNVVAGMTFGDVLNPVPEPGALLLTLFAAMGLGMVGLRARWG